MSYQLQGSVFGDMMCYDLAHTFYEKAYKIARESGDLELAAATFARKGVTYIQQKNLTPLLHLE